MYRNSTIGFGGHRHRPSYHPSPCTRTPPAWTALEGQARPQGVIGLEGGELHHNGTHWRSLLIQRKDRVPNGNVRTIRRLCAASLVGSTTPFSTFVSCTNNAKHTTAQ